MTAPNDGDAEPLDFDRRWQRASEDFTADATNRAFIEHARAAGRLPEAAGRYRQAKTGAGRDADAAIARWQAQIAALAGLRLDANTRAAPPRLSHRLVVAAAAVVLAAALYGLWRALALLGQ